MPLEATEAEWALQGPLNCTLFKELPMEKFFKHAPISETTDETEITYEAVGTSDGINNVTSSSNNSLQANVIDNQLIVNIPTSLIGKTLQIFSATGASMRSLVANGSQTTVNIENLTAGIYVVNVANQSVKFIKR